MPSEKRRITIHLRNDQDITVFLKKDSTTSLIDQIYDVFSGELSDNCIEVISDTDIGKEVILLRADEVIYVKTQEEDDE
jgi:hypothetical protein